MSITSRISGTSRLERAAELRMVSTPGRIPAGQPVILFISRFSPGFQGFFGNLLEFSLVPLLQPKDSLLLKPTNPLLLGLFLSSTQPVGLLNQLVRDHPIADLGDNLRFRKREGSLRRAGWGGDNLANAAGQLPFWPQNRKAAEISAAFLPQGQRS